MAGRGNKLVSGVGVNDADYITRESILVPGPNGEQKQKITWRCPFYNTWVGMLHRCYSEKSLKKYPSYADCTVCDEWLTFSNFKAWMELQDYEGLCLDKDLIVRGNKVYRPEACIFVSRVVNSFLIGSVQSKRDLPLGVTYSNRATEFQAHCRDFIKNKATYLGCFNNPQDAHKAWLSYKVKQAHILAAMQTDERVAKALIDRYENYEAYND